MSDYFSFTNPIDYKEVTFDCNNFNEQEVVDKIIETLKDQISEIIKKNGPSKYEISDYEIDDAWGLAAVQGYQKAAQEFDGAEWAPETWKAHVETYLKDAFDSHYYPKRDSDESVGCFFYEDWAEEFTFDNAEIKKLIENVYESAEKYDLDPEEMEDIIEVELRECIADLARDNDPTTVFDVISNRLTCEMAYIPGYKGGIEDVTTDRLGTVSSATDIYPDENLAGLLQVTNTSANDLKDYLTIIRGEELEPEWDDFDFKPEGRAKYPIITPSTLAEILDESPQGGAPCYVGRVNVQDWIMSDPNAVKVCRGGLVGLVEYMNGSGDIRKPINPVALDPAKGQWTATSDIARHYDNERTITSVVEGIFSINRNHMEIDFKDYQAEKTISQDNELSR